MDGPSHNVEQDVAHHRTVVVGDPGPLVLLIHAEMGRGRRVVVGDQVRAERSKRLCRLPLDRLQSGRLVAARRPDADHLPILTTPRPWER